MVDTIAAGSKWGAEDDTDNNLVVHSLVHRIPNCLLASTDGLPVASFGRTLTFGFGGDSQPIKSVSLPGVPLCLGVGPNGTRKRIAVGHQPRLMVVWPEIGGLHVAVACNERPNEHLVWLQGGRLYAVADNWLTRFHVKNRQIQGQGTIKLRGAGVIALVALTPGICGVVYDDGVIEGY